MSQSGGRRRKQQFESAAGELIYQLTLMASSLYRLLGCELGEEYARAKSRHIFRDFIDASASVNIDASEIVVRFQKRAHNPYLLAAGFDRKQTRIHWLANRRLRLVFG